MADLRSRLRERGARKDDERAQLVLVTALIIGVALIALVLLVNAAIYTENLATRNPDVGDEEAMSFEAAVVDGVGGIVDRENANDYGTYENVSANITDGITALDAHLERIGLEHGKITSINESTVSYSEGRLIRHTNESREFTSAGGSADWELAGGVTDARAHVATIHESQLVVTNASNANNDSAFFLNLEAGGLLSGEEWHAYVYKNQTTGEIAVAVKPGSVTDPSNATEVCSVAGPKATIDFTAGTIDGQDCPGLQWGEEITGDYNIKYINGDRANGTYHVTVNGTDSGTISIGTTLNEGPGASPYYVPAVYSAQVELTYRSPSLEYRRTVRVARGEPDA